MPAPFVRAATLAVASGIGLAHVRSWQSAYRGKMPRDYVLLLDLDYEEDVKARANYRSQSHLTCQFLI